MLFYISIIPFAISSVVSVILHCILQRKNLAVKESGTGGIAAALHLGSQFFNRKTDLAAPCPAPWIL